MKKQIYTEIKIFAHVNKVREIFFDFKNYKSWNPFIINIEGEFQSGSKIKVSMKIEGMKVQNFNPVIVKIDKNEFSWLGKLFLSGLFNGEHKFEIKENTPDETIFIQKENFSGILVNMILKKIGKQTEIAFNEMNLKLKSLCENS